MEANKSCEIAKAIRLQIRVTTCDKIGPAQTPLDDAPNQSGIFEPNRKPVINSI